MIKMNNSQFRKLVLDNTTRENSQSFPQNFNSGNPNNASTSVLGSRQRSSIHMTPRSVRGSNHSTEFTRQLSERNAESLHHNNKNQSSTIPKGTKLPLGYTDRTKSRFENQKDEAENDKEERIKALEKMMKKNEIDESTFTKIRDEIIGEETGIKRAGLVKGLDWRLLEKAKNGETVLEDILGGVEEDMSNLGQCDYDSRDIKIDIDKEFERLEKLEVQAVFHEKTKKKGEMAPPALTGKKRTRDQILAELKATRKAPIESSSRLQSKFKKIGEPRSENKIIRDNKGREILITIDENGNEKRKVRKLPDQQQQTVDKIGGLLVPNKDAKPLGMVVPEIPKANELEKDLDIFDDVGDDYDPLAELESNNQSDEENMDKDETLDSSHKNINTRADSGNLEHVIITTPSHSSQPITRNYFDHTTTKKLSPRESNGSSKHSITHDPSIIAALKKASEISLKITNCGDYEASKQLSESSSALHAKKERHKRMLQQDDRDAQDLDIGFGSSRIEDDDDILPRLSEWEVGSDAADKNKKRLHLKRKWKNGSKKLKGD